MRNPIDPLVVLELVKYPRCLLQTRPSFASWLRVMHYWYTFILLQDFVSCCHFSSSFSPFWLWASSDIVKAMIWPHISVRLSSALLEIGPQQFWTWNAFALTPSLHTMLCCILLTCIKWNQLWVLILHLIWFDLFDQSS